MCKRRARGFHPAGTIHLAAILDGGAAADLVGAAHGVPVVSVFRPAAQTHLVIVTRGQLARPRELVGAGEKRQLLPTVFGPYRIHDARLWPKVGRVRWYYLGALTSGFLITGNSE